MEIDPIRKRELYSAVTDDGMTLKEWFLTQADVYLRERLQPRLPLAAEYQAPYVRKPDR